MQSIRSLLTWGVALSLLLPVVLALVVGLGSLLQALGDHAGSIGCGRVALGLGVLWATAVATTAIGSGLLVLDLPRDEAAADAPAPQRPPQT
jgi:hypothetical protein